MENTLRKHITLPKATYEFLSSYQRQAGLANFSATIEAAADALKQQSLRAAYDEFASDFANSPTMQKEAEGWLNLPMDDK